MAPNCTSSSVPAADVPSASFMGAFLLSSTELEWVSLFLSAVVACVVALISQFDARRSATVSSESREMSKGEAHYVRLGNKHFGIGRIGFVIDLETTVDVQALTAAVAEVCEKKSCMPRCRVVGNRYVLNDVKTWKPMTFKVDQKIHPEEWWSKVESSRPTSLKNGFVALGVWENSSKFVISMDHCATDGCSFSQFTEDVLSAYRGEEFCDKNSTQRATMVSSMEDLAKNQMNVGYLDLIKVLWPEFVKPFLKLRSRGKQVCESKVDVATHCRDAPYKAHHAVFSSKQTETIKKNAKAHHAVTLNSVVAGAIISAIAKESKAKKGDCIGFSCPIDPRRRYLDGEDRCGYIASCMPAYAFDLPCDSNNKNLTIEAAKDFQAHLRNFVAGTGVQAQMRFGHLSFNALPANATKGLPAGILSNWGSLFPKNKSIVRDVVPLMNNGLLPTPTFVATTFDNKLRVTINGFSPNVSEVTMKNIIAEVEKSLLSL